jgi:hypothetical protein
VCRSEIAPPSMLINSFVAAPGVQRHQVDTGYPTPRTRNAAVLASGVATDCRVSWYAAQLGDEVPSPKDIENPVRRMVSLSAETAKAIDEYRFEHRITTESEAILPKTSSAFWGLLRRAKPTHRVNYRRSRHGHAQSSA